MPPVQNVFHILSTCDLKEPVTIVGLLLGFGDFWDSFSGIVGFMTLWLS